MTREPFTTLFTTPPLTRVRSGLLAFGFAMMMIDHDDRSILACTGLTAACSMASASICAALEAFRSARLPPVLHQSWVDEQPPKVLAAVRARWSEVLPSWTHRLWTDRDNRLAWAAHHPELLALYDGYPHGVQRADAARLLYMQLHGGVYADLDVAPCELTERALGRPALMLVRDPWRGSLRRKRMQHVSNFFFASPKGHPFWAYAIAGLPAHRNHPRGIMMQTGPYFVDSMWKRFVREARTCDAASRAPADSAGAEGGGALLDWLQASVLTHDEWQQRRVGTHHWASTWHYHAVIKDDGLVDWLGVNESASCPESSLATIVAGAKPGGSSLNETVLQTYPRTNGTRHRKLLTLRGEDTRQLVRTYWRWERIHKKTGGADGVLPATTRPHQQPGSRRRRKRARRKSAPAAGDAYM